jgi:hypothetical protein
MLMSFFLSVFISASVGTPGSMYTLDDHGKYSALSDFDATTRLHRSAAFPVAAAKADGNTTDNGGNWDGEWDDFNPPGLTPAIFSSRKWALMKKQQPKRRASKGTPSATASSSSSCSSASAPNKRLKRGCTKRVNYASLDDDDDDDDFE